MFIMIPDKALSNHSVSKSALILLGLIISLNNADYGCIAKNSYFAKRMNVSKKSINRYLVELKDSDMIYMDSFKKSNNVEIRVIVPSPNILTSISDSKKFLKKNTKNKNRLPKDIESEWLDDYINNL